jgi:hypothetical protein
MIKSKRMRWARHVARIGAERNAYRILLGKPEGKTPLENEEVGTWVILKWKLERYDGVIWTGLICLRIGTSRGL